MRFTKSNKLVVRLTLVSLALFTAVSIYLGTGKDEVSAAPAVIPQPTCNPANPSCLLDIPATTVSDNQGFNIGALIIPMDNIRQGNAGGTTFNLRAYGLANYLLQNGIPLKWAIKANKTKTVNLLTEVVTDQNDFTATVVKIQGIGGGPSGTLPSTGVSVPFAGGPLIVYPGFENLALPLIQAFEDTISGGGIDATDVVVYRATQPFVAPIRYNLTHKPKIAVGHDNAARHTDIFDDALIPNYSVESELALAGVNCQSCFTLITQPHTDEASGIETIKAFTQCGGNFMAQCLATNTYENGPIIFGRYQTNGNYIIENVETVMTYPNANMPPFQFIGALNDHPGGAEQDWKLSPGSDFDNNAYINAQNSSYIDHNLPVNVTDHYASTTSKLYYNGTGGIVTFLGGHSYDGASDIPTINGERVLLNMVLTPPKRNTDATCDIGIPLVVGFKSVKLGTETGDDVNSNGVINVGDTVVWTIHYVNIGSKAVTNFQITDTVPTNTLYINTPVPQPTLTNNSNDLTAALPNLLYAGSGNLLLPGARLGVLGRISVSLRTKIKNNACVPVCSNVINQAFGTGDLIPSTPTDDIDSLFNHDFGGGVVINPQAGSVPQDDLPTIDPTVVTLAAPTAADVEIDGRVVSTLGRGLAKVNMTLFDANTGETTTALTNSFGYFKFVDLEIGHLYTLNASSRQYQFPDGEVSFTLNDNLSGITMIGYERTSRAPVSNSRTPEAKPATTLRQLFSRGRAN